MKSTRRTTLIGVVLFTIFVYAYTTLALGQDDFEGEGTVPLFGLPNTLHGLLFWVLLPMVGSIITAIIFPRIFAPLFLKLKRKIYFRFEDTYLDGENASLTKRVFIIRYIYTALFTLGVLAFILPNIDGSVLVSTKDMASYVNEYSPITGEQFNPRYSMSSLGGVIGFVLPFVVGIWSIGWAMEDAGLMHYRLDDKRPGKMYEIEPVHIKYNSFLKGYAGISAIFFIIGVALYFNLFPGRISDSIMTFIMPFIFILLLLPAYYIYAKVNGDNKYLRKKLKPIRRITKEEIYSSVPKKEMKD